MTDFSYQLYSSRNFPPLGDTLKMLADVGYTQVEGFDGLFQDKAAVDALKAGLDQNGLVMPTGHFGLDLARDDVDHTMHIAKTLDVDGIFIPHLAQDERPKDAAGWAAFGAQLAEIGKPYLDAGYRFGWHNHDFEFSDIGGDDLPIDFIMQGGDDLSLELDIAWVQVGGRDPLAWIAKYADRMVAAHVKDIAPMGENMDEDGWADVGHGVMDWAAIVGALGQTNNKYLVMEHDNPSDDARFARRAFASVSNF
jgi:sugar phosphate isomerase/epimerase